MKIDERGAIAALLSQAEGNPRAMLRVAKLLRRNGDDAQAVALCLRALALAPADREFQVYARAFLGAKTPKWHFIMLRDQARAALYQQAIERVVRPGMRVLDIGAGSGLLAMMAARAGASIVYSCEAEPAIAATATAIVAANGYADRVQIIPRHSSTLDAERDLGGRVDVLISEIIGIDLLSEEVLPSHEHAIRHLLKPGGAILPVRGTIMVAAARHDGIAKRAPGMLAGFDLSLFGQLQPMNLHVRGDDPQISLAGPPAPLFTFDFTDEGPAAPDHASVSLRSDGGRVDGIVQWFDLEVHPGLHYENRPGPGVKRSWATVFSPLSAPRDTVAGDTIAAHGSHDTIRVTVWAD